MWSSSHLSLRVPYISSLSLGFSWEVMTDSNRLKPHGRLLWCSNGRWSELPQLRWYAAAMRGHRLPDPSSSVHRFTEGDHCLIWLLIRQHSRYCGWRKEISPHLDNQDVPHGIPTYFYRPIVTWILLRLNFKGEFSTLSFSMVYVIQHLGSATIMDAVHICSYWHLRYI